MPYANIAALLTCMSFFIQGARMEGKSTVLAGLLSFVVWLAASAWFGVGLVGGLVSQFLLFVALTAWGVFKESRLASRD